MSTLFRRMMILNYRCYLQLVLELELLSGAEWFTFTTSNASNFNPV